jgi:hypothetical protein
MAKLLLVLLISSIVTGLSPISHPMSSMQIMYGDEMGISYQSNMDHGNASENSMGSCCDEIAPFSIGCSFLIPQYACIDLSGDSNRVFYSSPLVHLIYIETITPPPKA